MGVNCSSPFSMGMRTGTARSAFHEGSCGLETHSRPSYIRAHHAWCDSRRARPRDSARLARRYPELVARGADGPCGTSSRDVGEGRLRRPTRESPGAIGADDGGGRVRTTMSRTEAFDGGTDSRDRPSAWPGLTLARCHVTLFGSDCARRFAACVATREYPRLFNNLLRCQRGRLIRHNLAVGMRQQAPTRHGVKLREIQLSPHALPVVQVRQHARVMVGGSGGRGSSGRCARWRIRDRAGRRGGCGRRRYAPEAGADGATGDGTGLEGVGEVTVRQVSARAIRARASWGCTGPGIGCPACLVRDQAAVPDSSAPTSGTHRPELPACTHRRRRSA